MVIFLWYNFFSIIIKFNMNTGAKQLIRIDNENYIWVIYIFILILNFISNKYEKDFLLYNKQSDKNNFLMINKTVVIILFIIYIYFLGLTIDDIKSLNINISKKQLLNLNLQLMANILFVIAGAILVYITFNNDY